MKARLSLPLIYFIASVLAVMAGCNPGMNNRKNDKGSVTVGGAYALYPLMEFWSEQFELKHPEINIHIFPSSSYSGYQSVVNNHIDIAMFSGDISKLKNISSLRFYPVAQDAVIVTMNVDHPLGKKLKETGITRSQLQDLFLNVTHAEQDYPSLSGVGDYEIQIITRADICGAGEIFADYLGGFQYELTGTGVHGDPGMIQALKSLKNSLGYNNMRYVYNISNGEIYKGIDVVPIDVDGNGQLDPHESIYNSLSDFKTGISRQDFPLSRILFVLVRNDNENEYVSIFLDWILTDGLEKVEEAGYVSLSAENTQAIPLLKKIKKVLAIAFAMDGIH